MNIQAWAAMKRGEALRRYDFDPGELGPDEVEIAVTHCGICHSDIHMIDNDWSTSQYPLVAGHEVVGTVRRVGGNVRRCRPGNRVGVGWQCGCCHQCEWCLRGDETCCDENRGTIVGRHGGFADTLIVDSRFAHPIPTGLSSQHAAPLLCAGITVYVPLKRHASPGSHVGIIGIGGLGHLAVQFARQFGCEVTAFSGTPAKREDAQRLGADRFVVTSHAAAMGDLRGSFDMLLSTATAPLPWPALLELLQPRGVLCLVGAPPGDLTVSISSLIGGNKSVSGSMIGNRAEMTEMLDFAARRGVVPQVDIMPMGEINAALERVRRNQARYRVVLTQE